MEIAPNKRRKNISAEARSACFEVFEQLWGSRVETGEHVAYPHGGNTDLDPELRNLLTRLEQDPASGAEKDNAWTKVNRQFTNWLNNKKAVSDREGSPSETLVLRERREQRISKVFSGGQEFSEKVAIEVASSYLTAENGRVSLYMDFINQRVAVIQERHCA